MFPQGDAHVLSSEPGLRAAPDMSAFARLSPPFPIVYELGGGGPERARFVCCFLGCDERPYNPLLTALPPVIHLAADGPRASGWLARCCTSRPAKSAQRAGRRRECAVAALRADVCRDDPPLSSRRSRPPQTGWLAGLRDPVVGQALAALHGAAERPVDGRSGCRGWSAVPIGARRAIYGDGRAAADAVSRAVADAARAPGCWPKAVRWRRRRRVGYESEAAFSRAFKKLVGQAPAMWRRATAPLAVGP